jgi:hypothetical protein
LRRIVIALCAAPLIALLLLSSACGGPAEAVSSGSPAPSASMETETETPAPIATPSPTPVPTPAPTEPPKGALVDGWVAGVPDYVPKFTYGTIDCERSKIDEGAFGSVFMLTYAGVKLADLETYAAALKGAGYDVAAAQIGDTYTLIATRDMGYGKVTIVVTLSGEGGALFALEAPV